MTHKNLIFISLFLTFIISCSQPQSNTLGINQTATTYIRIDSLSSLSPDSTIEANLKPYKDSVDEAMNIVIGYANQEIFKNQPNGSLNNLTAEMVLEISKQTVSEGNLIPDICLLNYGGLRYPLPKGNITLANIYQLMPFQNEVVILKLTGKQIESLFNYIAASNGQPIAGCIVSIKKNKYVSATIGGKQFDLNKTYNVVTSDYLADGGDKMSFLKNPIETFKTGILIRSAMIDYIKQQTASGKKIEANNEERIKII